MFWFALASLTPAICLALGCLWGGAWAVGAVLSITVWVFFMDRLVARLMPDTLDTGGLGLSFTLAAAHFALWALGIWAIATNPILSGLDKVLLVTGLGLYFGQVSNSNAHELIHRAAKGPRRLGITIYGSLLFAHHTSAHMRVHHVWAATARDPNTARLGEGYWTYLWRAWRDEFRAGKQAEDRLRAGRDAPAWAHPYVGYVALTAAALAVAWMLAGLSGILALLAIAAYAQMQLYLSDYVQHYGLERQILPSGKPEPMGPEHSWNAPHWYSSAMMLNAPRHSDHHLNPAKPYPQLDLTRGAMPILPHSLPVMAVLALVPPVWRRLMDKRAQRWRGAQEIASAAQEPLAAPAAS